MTIVDLTERLLALRSDLRQRLAVAEALDSGLLGILADVETVLASLDRDAEAEVRRG